MNVATHHIALPIPLWPLPEIQAQLHQFGHQSSCARAAPVNVGAVANAEFLELPEALECLQHWASAGSVQLQDAHVAGQGQQHAGHQGRLHRRQEEGTPAVHTRGTGTVLLLSPHKRLRLQRLHWAVAVATQQQPSIAAPTCSSSPCSRTCQASGWRRAALPSSAMVLCTSLS